MSVVNILPMPLYTGVQELYTAYLIIYLIGFCIGNTIAWKYNIVIDPWIIPNLKNTNWHAF